MHHDARETSSLEPPVEPSDEYNDMPELESRTPSSTPHSPFLSTTAPPSSPPALRHGRNIIVLLIPLLFFLFLNSTRYQNTITNVVCIGVQLQKIGERKSAFYGAK